MKKILFLFLIIVIIVIGFFILKSPIANRFSQKALDFYKAQDYVSAEKYFTKAIFWKRNSVEFNINLAKTLLNLDENDKCEKIISRLSRIAADNAEFLALNGQLLVKKKNYELGLESLNKAIEADSLLSYAFYYRGIAKANLNDLDGAASDYTKAQELDKSNIKALKEGTLLFVKLENYEASIENYDKLLELDPKNIDAFMQRGTFKTKIGDFKNAINDFSQVIKLSPEKSEAYFERGKAYGQNNDFTEAVKDFDKTYSLNYKRPSSLFNLGMAWLNLQKPDKARKSLEACINITSDNEYIDDSYQLLGTLELMQNNNKESITYFNKSIKADSKNANTYYNRAIAYGNLKEYQKALDDLNISIEKGKNDGEVYFARGIQKINLNDFKGGCSDLSVASDKGFAQAIEMKKTYCK